MLVLITMSLISLVLFQVGVSTDFLTPTTGGYA